MSSGKRRTGRLVVGVVAVLLVGVVFAFEPITRKVVSQDGLCSYCHVAVEYRAGVRLAYSGHHPLPGEDGKAPEDETRCVDCHMPAGFLQSTYAYLHFASLTDLFGHFRHRTVERAGPWRPARQAAAWRVRDRLFEYDSPTCRSCHVMEEIEPRRERGVNAHKKAVDEEKTCIECHYNEKHRPVDVRDDAFVRESGGDA